MNPETRVEELEEIMRDAWDILIRPHHPPIVEPTAEEHDILLRYTLAPGFDEGMRKRLHREIAYEDCATVIKRFLEWDALTALPDPLPAPFADLHYWVSEFRNAVARVDEMHDD